VITAGVNTAALLKNQLSHLSRFWCSSHYDPLHLPDLCRERLSEARCLTAAAPSISGRPQG
jgi:hypothetical protein